MIFIAVWLQQEDIAKEVFCCQATFSSVLQLERNRFPCAFLFVSASGSKLEGVKCTIEEIWEATGNQGTYCYVPPCILKSEGSLTSFYLTEISYGCLLYYVFQVYEEGQKRNSIVPNPELEVTSHTQIQIFITAAAQSQYQNLYQFSIATYQLPQTQWLIRTLIYYLTVVVDQKSRHGMTGFSDAHQGYKSYLGLRVLFKVHWLLAQFISLLL